MSGNLAIFHHVERLRPSGAVTASRWFGRHRDELLSLPDGTFVVNANIVHDDDLRIEVLTPAEYAAKQPEKSYAVLK